MSVERSAGAVIFRGTKNGREYLLLQHHAPIAQKLSKSKPGHWDFPKGHLEKGESGMEAARREIKEETGISRIDFESGFKQTIRYFVKIGSEQRLKFVVFFLGQTKQKKVEISHEHQDWAWLNYKEARERLTYANAKNILKKAHEFLEKRGSFRPRRISARGV